MKDKFINIIIKIIIIVVIAIIIALGFFLYSNAKTGKNQNEKLQAEIEYLDTKITSLINYINGINLQNYKISISKVEESQGNTNTDESEKESSKEEEDQGEEESKDEKEITKMEQEQTVSDAEEVNWNWIQGETEVFYSVWATIVLDLYDVGVPGEEIMGFSNTLDQTLISIKNKDKLLSAANFARLYSFTSGFANKFEIEERVKIAVQTKSHLLNAYAYVEEEAWDKIQMEIVNAEKDFTGIVNNISESENQKKHCINKTYILLQELKNSIATKDSGIFYIKYKNLLESLNTLI